MTNELKISKRKFIFEWVQNNFYAWAVFGFILNFSYSLLGPGPSPVSVIATFMNVRIGSTNAPIGFFFYIAILALLFGASLGCLQWYWLKIKLWRIQPFWWIFVTALGWGFSSLLSSFPFVPYLISNLPLVSLAIGLLLVGIVIGTLQAIVWRKPFQKSLVWIGANALGMFIFGLAICCVIFFPFTYKPFFRNILYWVYSYLPSNLYYIMVFPPKFVYWFFIYPIIIPILGAICTALPTGFILHKEFHSKIEDHSIETKVELQQKSG